MQHQQQHQHQAPLYRPYQPPMGSPSRYTPSRYTPSGRTPSGLPHRTSTWAMVLDLLVTLAIGAAASVFVILNYAGVVFPGCPPGVRITFIVVGSVIASSATIILVFSLDNFFATSRRATK